MTSSIRQDRTDLRGRGMMPPIAMKIVIIVIIIDDGGGVMGADNRHPVPHATKDGPQMTL
jgi:hypothetical protein